MDIKLKKWDDNIGLQIPQKVAESFGIDERSIVELTASKDALVIKKKGKVTELDELLASIPKDFDYPDDMLDFIESPPVGREMI